MTWRLIGVPFSSTFDVVCPACRQPIRRGDLVAREIDRSAHDPEHHERYVHAGCASGAL